MKRALEIEAELDASLLHDRLTVEFTYYDLPKTASSQLRLAVVEFRKPVVNIEVQQRVQLALDGVIFGGDWRFGLRGPGHQRQRDQGARVGYTDAQRNIRRLVGAYNVGSPGVVLLQECRGRAHEAEQVTNVMYEGGTISGAATAPWCRAITPPSVLRRPQPGSVHSVPTSWRQLRLAAVANSGGHYLSEGNVGGSRVLQQLEAMIERTVHSGGYQYMGAARRAS